MSFRNNWPQIYQKLKTPPPDIKLGDFSSKLPSIDKIIFDSAPPADSSSALAFVSTKDEDDSGKIDSLHLVVPNIDKYIQDQKLSTQDLSGDNLAKILYLFVDIISHELGHIKDFKPGSSAPFPGGEAVAESASNTQLNQFKALSQIEELFSILKSAEADKSLTDVNESDPEDLSLDELELSMIELLQPKENTDTVSGMHFPSGKDMWRPVNASANFLLKEGLGLLDIPMESPKDITPEITNDLVGGSSILNDNNLPPKNRESKMKSILDELSNVLKNRGHKEASSKVYQLRKLAADDGEDLLDKALTICTPDEFEMSTQKWISKMTSLVAQKVFSIGDVDKIYDLIPEKKESAFDSLVSMAKKATGISGDDKSQKDSFEKKLKELMQDAMFVKEDSENEASDGMNFESSEQLISSGIISPDQSDMLDHLITKDETPSVQEIQRVFNISPESADAVLEVILAEKRIAGMSGMKSLMKYPVRTKEPQTPATGSSNDISTLQVLLASYGADETGVWDNQLNSAWAKFVDQLALRAPSDENAHLLEKFLRSDWRSAARLLNDIGFYGMNITPDVKGMISFVTLFDNKNTDQVAEMLASAKSRIAAPKKEETFEEERERRTTEVLDSLSNKADDDYFYPSDAKGMARTPGRFNQEEKLVSGPIADLQKALATYGAKVTNVWDVDLTKAWTAFVDDLMLDLFRNNYKVRDFFLKDWPTASSLMTHLGYRDLSGRTFSPDVLGMIRFVNTFGGKNSEEVGQLAQKAKMNAKGTFDEYFGMSREDEREKRLDETLKHLESLADDGMDQSPNSIEDLIDMKMTGMLTAHQIHKMIELKSPPSVRDLVIEFDIEPDVATFLSELILDKITQSASIPKAKVETQNKVSPTLSKLQQLLKVPQAPKWTAQMTSAWNAFVDGLDLGDFLAANELKSLLKKDWKTFSHLLRTFGVKGANGEWIYNDARGMVNFIESFSGNDNLKNLIAQHPSAWQRATDPSFQAKMMQEAPNVDSTIDPTKKIAQDANLGAAMWNPPKLDSEPSVNSKVTVEPASSPAQVDNKLSGDGINRTVQMRQVIMDEAKIEAVYAQYNSGKRLLELLSKKVTGTMSLKTMDQLIRTNKVPSAEVLVSDYKVPEAEAQKLSTAMTEMMKEFAPKGPSSYGESEVNESEIASSSTQSDKAKAAPSFASKASEVFSLLGLSGKEKWDTEVQAAWEAFLSGLIQKFKGDSAKTEIFDAAKNSWKNTAAKLGHSPDYSGMADFIKSNSANSGGDKGKSGTETPTENKPLTRPEEKTPEVTPSKPEAKAPEAAKELNLVSEVSSRIGQMRDKTVRFNTPFRPEALRIRRILKKQFGGNPNLAAQAVIEAFPGGAEKLTEMIRKDISMRKENGNTKADGILFESLFQTMKNLGTRKTTV